MYKMYILYICDTYVEYVHKYISILVFCYYIYVLYNVCIHISRYHLQTSYNTYSWIFFHVIIYY